MRKAAGRMSGLRVRSGSVVPFLYAGAGHDFGELSRAASPLRNPAGESACRWMACMILAALLCASAPAAAAPAAAPARPAESPLSLSLPEVVIESPDLERLIARRVRPAPPGRLGVRLPDVLIEGEVPPMTLPARPLPAEREPDPELTQAMGRITRFFGSGAKIFETGLAYWKKGQPVEALAFFEEAARKAGEPGPRGAALFWGAEAALRLGKEEDARRLRGEILRLPPLPPEPYASAARYALAEEACRGGGHRACLAALDGGRWRAEDFASGEARLLRAWAHERLGARPQALAALAGLAEGGGAFAARALAALGHLHRGERDFPAAERAYGQAEASGPPRGAGEAAILGEALHGLGWVRLQTGRAEEAGRAFALFLRRHPGHPLTRSAEAGALAARFEAALKGEGAALDGALPAFLRKYPRSPEEGPLQLQLAWSLFRREDYAGAARRAASVSDAYPLGRIYRLARVIEGLSLYHQGEVRRAYGVLRLGAESPPAEPGRQAERSAARSAAMATAFAAFRLKDFAGAQAILAHWAFGAGGEAPGTADDPEAALWYGEAAFEAGDLDAARRAFASIPAGAPERLRGRAGLAWVHYRRQEWREAAALFDRVMEGEPAGPLAAEALARAGEARFNLGDFAGAVRAFEGIERRYAGGEAAREAILQRGKLLLRRGRFGEAEEAFRAFLSKFPGSPAAPEVEYWSALVPFRRGEFEAARVRLLDFAERRKESPLAGEAYLRAADAFYNEGKYLQADRLYRLVMARFPDHPRHREAAYGLLLTRLQREEFEEFLREGRAFAARYPSSPLSVALSFQLGEVNLTRGDLDEAHRAYREVAARYPENELAAHALLRIGAIHRRRQNVDAALDAYESLLTRYPESRLRADALFGAGETLAGIGRCAEAKRRFEEFLSKFAGHDFALLARFELGRCEARLGDDRAAAGHMEAVAGAEAAGAGGVRAQAALLLAALKTKAGDLDGAERALGVALGSDDPAVAAEALFGRAELLARRGDPSAPAEFLKLTYRHPDQKMWAARALGRAGELYEKAGNRATALRIFQKMRQAAPPGALRQAAEEAVRRLGEAPAAKR